ncbi:MAG: hypothetical protein PHE52_02890 [Candidatus Pacebacteria bacterium]|nr:hypothetical protein [Candidatus Paceibacterota bacterium]
MEKSIKFYPVKGYNDLMTRKQLPLIIIIAVILGGLVFGFYYWFQYMKPGLKSPGSEEKEGTTTQTEISQEEAINLALEKYPGEIKSIVKPEIISERNISSPDFWLVEIALENPMFFEKTNKEIKIIKVKVTMDKNVDIYELVE